MLDFQDHAQYGLKYENQNTIIAGIVLRYVLIAVAIV